MKVVVHVDGGARGNPGPAAAGAVVSTPDGEVLADAAEAIGVATNNVAEYRGLLLGLYVRARGMEPVGQIAAEKTEDASGKRRNVEEAPDPHLEFRRSWHRASQLDSAGLTISGNIRIS